MIYINVTVVLMVIFLAVISRKNKSKYKDENALSALFFCMADTICCFIIKRFRFTKISELMGRIYICTNRKNEEKTREFLIDVIAKGLIILCIANVFSGIIFIKKSLNEKNKTQIVVRQGYEGSSDTYKLKLENEQEEETYELVVYPIEYTKDEFEEKANEIYTNLKTEIVGENADLTSVTEDLELPSRDDNSLFKFSWSSDSPEVLSSSGTVRNEEINKSISTKLNLKIGYANYSKEFTYDITVVPDDLIENDSELTLVNSELLRLESENRTEKELTLPSKIDNVKISLVQEDDNLCPKIVIMGTLGCLGYGLLKFSKLKEKADKRECELTSEYSNFVERLWLLLGTGMTIKASIKHIAADENICIPLRNELEYAINLMDMGESQTRVYEQLGERIGIKQYEKLFNYISQNLKKGTSNIREILMNTVYESTEEGRENIKKKGEQASTKLLLPMVVMLAVVMIIIIAPAVFTI